MSPRRLEQLVARLAAEPTRWQRLVRHEHDARVYEQLPLVEEDVNAWLICWSGGQDTGFHDHDISAGAIAVLAGRVREERLAVGSPAIAREFGAGRRFSIPPNAIHRVLHAGTAPAITLHAYSPPLLRMGTYAVGAHGELERRALTCEQELRPEHRLIEALG
jgi:predicted metal-dependent enzyme (double-stranded beta helix superfamily)